MNLHFSIIIPVYNRPEELDDLLNSIEKQIYKKPFQIIVIDDGSEIASKNIIEKYNNFDITYFYKDNSGPGQTRNYGMQKATGNYYIILDSDCMLPKHYLENVDKALNQNYTDAYGGADASSRSFSDLQKAISYAMTSIFTTGGIRGNKKLKKFQPRSFNMGISKEAFLKTKGFSNINFGEDIDLTFRLWKNSFKTQFIEKAYVYHKRRTSWKQFFNQTFNFGAARPILNKLHKGTAKITYWFPSLFVIGLLFSLLALFFQIKILISLISIYFLIILIHSVYKNNIKVALYSLIATLVMFLGYGLGFLRSTIRLTIFNKSIKNAFPEMFR